MCIQDVQGTNSTQQAHETLKIVCQSQISNKACIQLQLDCLKHLQSISTTCSDVLTLQIQNSSTFTPLTNQMNFEPQNIIFSNFSQILKKFSKSRLFLTIYNLNGEILYDGPSDTDFCQLILRQSSFDEQRLWQLSDYQQKGRFDQFGVSQRSYEFQNVKWKNHFNQNFTSLRSGNFNENKSFSCYFSNFNEELFLSFYMIDIEDNIQQLYFNLTYENITVQQVKFVPLLFDDYMLKDLQVELGSQTDIQIHLNKLQATYQKIDQNNKQESLITSYSNADPNLLYSDNKRKMTYSFKIINRTGGIKVAIVCIFGVIGFIMSTIKCCNNSGSYQFGVNPTKSLKIKEVNGEIQENYQQNFWHFLTWIMDILSYICLGFSFSAFIGSFQLYSQSEKDKLPVKQLVSFKNSELIAMYIISTVCFIYQRIYSSKFKYFFYQTQWTDNISTNLQDSRLIYIINKFYDLQKQQPSNILFIFMMTIMFYYLYDEFYRPNQQAIGFDSVNTDLQAYSFVFIFTLSNIIDYVVRHLLQYIIPNKFTQFEQVLGSNDLSLIIQDSPYTFTVISQQSESADILDIAQEQQARANYTIQDGLPKVARYYLTQQQQDTSTDLIQEIQRLNAYCKFQVQNANKKTNGVKENKIFDMIHFLPDIYQIAGNARALASGQKLVDQEKMSSFMNLPWFVDINIQGSKIYKAETFQFSSGLFIDRSCWKKWIGRSYWWSLYLSFITLSILFYTQVCKIGGISFILVLVIYEIIQSISNNIMKNQLSFTNCIEKQWIN